VRHFDGVHAFVTGGSSGIGNALARQLAAAGAHVHIAARRREALDTALATLEAHRVRPDQHLSAHPLDVTDADAARGVIDALAAGGAAPQLVINNAGAVPQQLTLDPDTTHRPGYLEATPPAVFRQLIEVNYLGAVNVCRAAAPYLKRGAHIVNLSSGAAILPMPGYGAYTASKWALGGFSEVLRFEMRQRGVRVSVVYPPDTDTPQYRAERDTRAPEVNAVSALSSVMTADKAARLILRGVRRGGFHIPIGADTALTFRLLRPLEWVKFTVLDALYAIARRRTNKAPPTG
jgi:3-dehydrosphinganine reductase